MDNTTEEVQPETPAPEPRHAAPLSRNIISSIGLLIALLAATNLIFLIIADLRHEQSNPYMGVLTWIVAPAILIFGLSTYVAGLLLERRRRRRMAPEDIPEYPRVDLNETRTRRLVVFTAIGLVLFVTVSVVGSYQAYHYTETDAFCGTMCHEVMHPEYTAYLQSPHARVGCAGCHVGKGAGWYVRSKLSGAYQVYATVTNKFPRPIPTPVPHLRPAQETCEQCHWPEKFFGAQLKVFEHYSYDEPSTPRDVRMLIKVGGGRPDAGQTAGIHWHMNINNEVTYAATDPQRQTIPWVRVRNRQTGQVTEYRAQDSKLTDAQLAAVPKRTMDCVDCHNRPTHIYTSPDRSVDVALRGGLIDRTLPFIKQQAVAVLAADYPSTEAAVAAIPRDLDKYYRENHADIYPAKQAQIAAAGRAVQQLFRNTRFPEMKVDWRTHPDNVGHMRTLGCFRCHDDQHVTKDGKTLSKDCDICHTALSADGATAAFEHPVDLGDMRQVNCSDCHTGGGM